MAKSAPPSEATLPGVGDSPTCGCRCSSLINAITFAYVDALTISPGAAAAASAAATVSKVSLSILFHILV